MVAPVVAGALISGGASLLGGIFGRKAEKRAAARNRANEIEDARLKFTRLRESAELGGFNPLTALETTGGAGFAFSGGNVAPLASIAMITNGIREASKAFTGEAAQEQRRYDLETDLAKVRLDQVKAEIQAVRQVGKIASGVSRMGTQKTAGLPIEYIPQELPKDPNGEIAGATPLYQDVVLPDGSTVRVPAPGVDPDESLFGGMIAGYAKVRDGWFGKALGESAQILGNVFAPFEMRDLPKAWDRIDAGGKARYKPTPLAIENYLGSIKR